MALVPVVQRRIQATQQLDQMIAEINDPLLRREIRKDFDALSTSRLPATLPSASSAPPAKTSIQSQASPHARQTVLGLEQGYALNGGGRNGHP
jgi:hypothetical protein